MEPFFPSFFADDFVSFFFCDGAQPLLIEFFFGDWLDGVSEFVDCQFSAECSVCGGAEEDVVVVELYFFYYQACFIGLEPVFVDAIFRVGDGDGEELFWEVFLGFLFFEEVHGGNCSFGVLIIVYYVYG